ncbi:MAG: hypothetical protein N2169_07725 [bacterium]|nr:hypothetical protein [bacterium]
MEDDILKYLVYLNQTTLQGEDDDAILLEDGDVIILRFLNKTLLPDALISEDNDYLLLEDDDTIEVNTYGYYSP